VATFFGKEYTQQHFVRYGYAASVHVDTNVAALAHDGIRRIRRNHSSAAATFVIDP